MDGQDKLTMGNVDYPWDSSQLLNFTIALLPYNELETTSVYYVNKLGPMLTFTVPGLVGWWV